MRAPARTLCRVGAAVAALLLAGCGGDDPATEAPDGDATVSIVDNDYEPSTIRVAVGDTVEWTNTGSVTHTVTFADGPDSGMMQGDATYRHTFDEAGEFSYVCVVHPGMEGTVEVTE